MTLFVGEQVPISHTATKKIAGVTTALTPANVTSVLITIYSAAGTAVVAETAMTWDAAESFWLYLWDTTALTAGTYRARVRIVGVTGYTGSVWAWKRIRLACNPA